MTEFGDLKELIAQEQSIIVDFSTFLALFSLFVIFYYMVKWVRRKAEAAIQRERTDMIYTVGVQRDEALPKESEKIVEEESTSISKKPRQLPYDSLLETQRKQRRKGYGLVDHSTTVKKKDKTLASKQKKTQLYCPINVEAALGGKSQPSQ